MSKGHGQFTFHSLSGNGSTYVSSKTSMQHLMNNSAAQSNSSLSNLKRMISNESFEPVMSPQKGDRFTKVAGKRRFDSSNGKKLHV